MIPTIGRTVHYVLPKNHRHAGQHRAAVISQVWSDKGQDPTEMTPVQLHVFLDSMNDPEGNAAAMLVIRDSLQDPTGTTGGSWHQAEPAPVPPAAKPAIKAKGELVHA